MREAPQSGTQESENTSATVDDVTAQTEEFIGLSGPIRGYDQIEQVLDSIEVGILVISRDKRILFANQVALAYYDVSLKEAQYAHCYDLQTLRRCGECEHDCLVQRVFETGDSQRAIRVFQTANYSRQYYEVHASPLYSPERDITAVVETIRDITHQQEMEKQLKNIENLAILGRIVAGVAHEVNGSMASVATCVEGLARALNDPAIRDLPQFDYVPRYLDTMRRCVYRCKSSLEDALRLVREEDFHWQWVDVHEILRDVLPLVCYEAERADKEVRTRLREGRALIWADARQLARVFINLLHNGLDAIGAKDGYVEISTRPLPEGVQIVILDTGSGISPEHRSRVFEPFFSTKPAGQGTGLGLPVSLQILDRHKATLSLESEPGIGTTIRIDLLRDPREVQR